MPYFLRRVQRRAAGALLIDGEHMDTLMCPHCQHVWVPNPGSGKRRGWCFSCGAATCGKQACSERCTPYEKVLEQVEARARVDRNLDVLRRS